ncbi:hypothetical protein [Kitasatospora phosalacinea]|nr:hypothetical protein [Kitasatospora phosalacinea]
MAELAALERSVAVLGLIEDGDEPEEEPTDPRLWAYLEHYRAERQPEG